MESVEYYDRKLKKIFKEKIFGHAILAFFYPESGGIWSAFGKFLCAIYSKFPFFSHFYGWVQRSKWSRKKVKPFVDFYNVDASEFLKKTGEFKSFDDFFVRKLTPSARPIDKDPKSLVAPCDGRFLFFQNLSSSDQFYVKGQKFSLSAFLQNERLASEYDGGPAVFARLCPVDYHRFHFPCAGIPKPPSLINGPLFSVSPLALKKNLSYLWENKRYIIEFETELFGKALFVAIGATNVGSVTYTYRIENQVEKGEECGFFSFGGSSVMLLFKDQAFSFDPDLIDYSLKGIETRCLLGDRIATIS